MAPLYDGSHYSFGWFSNSAVVFTPRPPLDSPTDVIGQCFALALCPARFRHHSGNQDQSGPCPKGQDSAVVAGNIYTFG